MHLILNPPRLRNPPDVVLLVRISMRRPLLSPIGLGSMGRPCSPPFQPLSYLLLASGSMGPPSLLTSFSTPRDSEIVPSVSRCSGFPCDDSFQPPDWEILIDLCFLADWLGVPWAPSLLPSFPTPRVRNPPPFLLLVRISVRRPVLSHRLAWGSMGPPCLLTFFLTPCD